MVVSYLLYDRQFDTASNALQYFAEARTQTAQVSASVCVCVFLAKLFAIAGNLICRE